MSVGQGGIVGKQRAQKSQPERSLSTSCPDIFGYSLNKRRDLFIFDHGLRVKNQCNLLSELMSFFPRLLLPPALIPTQVSSIWGPRCGFGKSRTALAQLLSGRHNLTHNFQGKGITQTVAHAAMMLSFLSANVLAML